MLVYTHLLLLVQPSVQWLDFQKSPPSQSSMKKLPIFGAKWKWKLTKRDKSTSCDFVDRGRPLRGKTRLAPLAKRSTWSTSIQWLSIVTFNNDAKPPPKWILPEFDVSRIRPRLGGLPHLETFTWQNLTPAERVTRSGRPGYPPWRVIPLIM